DEGAVALDQGGPGEDPLPGVLRGLHAADAHQGDPVAHPGVQPAQHLQGALLEGGAGEAAGLGGEGRRGGQALAGDGGVGGDDAVQAEFDGEVGDGVDVLVGEIGGDLDEEGDPAGGDGAVRGLADGGQQRPQGLGGLEVAQPGGV